MRRVTRSIAMGIAAALAGCVAYNEDCTPLVDNPDEVVGYLATEVDITKARVRTGDNPVGELVAEAYLHALDAAVPDGGAERPQVGVENAGAIRSEGICQSHDVLPKGPVLKKTLREVLAFDDTITVVSISVHTLKNVLEHAVSDFADATRVPVGPSPSGQFLQIAGIAVQADCTRPPESQIAEGQRITRIDLAQADGTPSETLWDGMGTPSDARTVRIAVNSFLLQGGNGFTMLQDVSQERAQPYPVQGLNFQIVARYFVRTYTRDHPLAPSGAPRWTLSNCK